MTQNSLVECFSRCSPGTSSGQKCRFLGPTPDPPSPKGWVGRGSLRREPEPELSCSRSAASGASLVPVGVFAHPEVGVCWRPTVGPGVRG